MENEETLTPTPVNNDSADTINSVEIPNAQAEKYNEIPQTQSSNPETEDTYVDYRVTHVEIQNNHKDLLMGHTLLWRSPLNCQQCKYYISFIYYF